MKTYIEHLKKEKTKIFFKEFEGCYHAFDMMAPFSKEAKEASTFFIQSFEYALNNFEAKQKR